MIKNQIIKFNPNLGLEDIETGESFSPDVSLLHELGHMANAKEDPDKFHDRKFTPNEKWKDEEEKYNIEKWEQPYAESRDMMQRTKGYEKGYKTIRTVNSTSNKKENE